MAMDPTTNVSASTCSVSMVGNSQPDSLIAIENGCDSSHWQKLLIIGYSAYAIQRPATTMPIHSRSDTKPVTLAVVLCLESVSHAVRSRFSTRLKPQLIA